MVVDCACCRLFELLTGENHLKYVSILCLFFRLHPKFLARRAACRGLAVGRWRSRPIDLSLTQRSSRHLTGANLPFGMASCECIETLKANHWNRP